MKKLKNKTKGIIAGVSAFAVIGVSGIMAYFTDTATVTNHVTMGIVDIDLNEFTINEEGQREKWEDKTNITPGEVISKIPEISCAKGAVDCYVRAKVEIYCKDTDLQEHTEMLTLEDLDVDKDKWYYCPSDGYFYYKEILTENSDPVALFTKVKIPSELNNEWSLEQISIDVTAEAIQSKNFTPNFDAGTSNPWPGITDEDIIECIYPDHIKYKE